MKKFQAGKGLKVPHMGWNQIQVTRSPGHQVTSKLFQDIDDGSYVYFCHSYYPDPKDKTDVAAICNYGLDFACAVHQENVYGAQFHPEKSQATGLKMLDNFVKLC